MKTIKLFFLRLLLFLGVFLNHLFIFIKNSIQKQNSPNYFIPNNKTERQTANLLVTIMLFISQFAFAQNALKATGGTGAFKNDIYWLNFSGVSNLGPGGTTSLSRNFTINGVDVTVTIDNISFSGQVTGGGNTTGVRLRGRTPGTWTGDGLDDLYNIGGTGTLNTLVNSLGTNLNGNGNGNELFSNFRIRAYATVSGQPMDIGLVFASAEDDADNEYSQGTTNGSPWKMIERAIQASANNGNRAVTFSNSNLTANMRMGSATGLPGVGNYGANPANVAILYTSLQASSSANPLSADVQFKGSGGSAIALGIFLRQDFGDAPGSYFGATNIYSPVTSGGNNNPPAGGGTVYLSTGTGGGSPVITAATLGDPQTLRLGNLGGDANEVTYPTAGNGTSDNATGVADEDAFASLPSLTTSSTSYSLSIPAFKNTTTASTPAYIMAWVDFDKDGKFGANEYTTASFTDNNTLTNVPLVWNLSGNAITPSNTFARFRITTTNPSTLVDNTGTVTDERSFIALANGETEDYPNIIIVGAPIANNDVLSAQASTPATIPSLIGNDVKGPNGAALSPDGVSLIAPSGATGITTDGQGDITGFTVPGQGTWAYNSTTGSLTFTPQGGFTGNPTPINYTVRSPEGIVSNLATVTITYDLCTISASNPDSDGDGISDACDVDDDNDGIVDTVEYGNCNTGISRLLLSEDFGTGTTRTSTPYSNYCYEDGTGSCPSFPGNVNLNDGEYTIVRFANPDAANFATWTTAPDHTGNLDGRQLVINASFTQGEFYRRTVNVTPNVPVNVSYWVKNVVLPGGNRILPNVNVRIETADGVLIAEQASGPIPENNTWTLDQSVFNPGNNTAVQFVLINNASGGSGNDLAIDDISVSQVFCDTDSDGIADYLDSDSDNDGCVDAIEGAGTINYSQLNSNNQISGSVDTNGVPTAASGGQAVGSSANSTVTAPECSTCNVGNPAFIDSDGDGIGNDCDQDDDNDGILDVNEARTLGTANGTNTQYVNVETTAFNASLGGCTNVNFKINDATNQIGTYKSFTQAQIDFSAIVTQDLGVPTTVPIVGAFSTSSPNNTTLGDITYLVTPGKFEQFNVYIADPENTSFVIRAYDAANNQLQAVDWSVATFSRTTPSSPSSFLAMPIINSNNVTYSPTSNQSQMPEDAFRVRFGEATMKNAVKIVISINRNNTASTNVDEIEYFVSGVCLGDTDGDGTPDKFDLDSDNDGCLDAIEGGANVLFSQLVNSAGTVSVGTGSPAPNQNLCNNASCVGQTGLPSVMGSVGAPNGQSVGSSQDSAVRAGCEPDLSIVKTVNNATPNVGSQIEFSLAVKNNGIVTANGVTVNDLLPSGYTYQSVVAPAGTTYTPATGVWSIGTLASGATTTLVIRALANSTGNYLNTATVSSSETDPVPANNSSSATTTPVVQNECMGTTATKLNLSGGVLISGTANTVGAKYKYSNVIAGTGVTQQADIVFELTALDFGSPTLASNYNFVYDVPQTTAGIENNFQPSFVRSTTGSVAITNGTYHQSSTWKATIFKAGTTTPYNVPTIIQVIDNDGSVAASTSTFESVEFLSPLPAQILISSPTTQVITGNIVKSNGAVQTGIGVDPQYSAYGNYGLANEFSFKLDNEVIINGSSGSINSNLANRYASVNFGCDFSGTNNFTKQTVSGTVYTDTDGGAPSGIPYINGNVFANLVDANGHIAASQMVSTTNGTYSFANVIAGTYTVLLTNAAQTVGAVAPLTSSLPPNYVNVTSTDASPTDGITSITVGTADITGVNFGINLDVCYETPTDLTTLVPVKHGITVLGRAGKVSAGTANTSTDWPMIRNSAYTALEGKAKGFVVTRNSSPETTIVNPVVGMMVFDTNEGATGCLKIYTGSGAGEGWKCFSTQGCP